MKNMQGHVSENNTVLCGCPRGLGFGQPENKLKNRGDVMSNKHTI
jgi:hypothetical protein